MSKCHNDWALSLYLESSQEIHSSTSMPSSGALILASLCIGRRLRPKVDIVSTRATMSAYAQRLEYECTLITTSFRIQNYNDLKVLREKNRILLTVSVTFRFAFHRKASSNRNVSLMQTVWRHELVMTSPAQADRRDGFVNSPQHSYPRLHSSGYVLAPFLSLYPNGFSDPHGVFNVVLLILSNTK